MGAAPPQEGIRATWLELEPDPVLAFLHPAAGRPRGTAVLICPPFGWHEMCSYRRRRRWAEALADAGFAAARIDLPATGDSGGGPRDPARVDAWTRAIAGAARWLRSASGAERVTALGIGLGGLLAVRALASGAELDDLLLWAVPARGQSLVREMRAYAGVVATRFNNGEQAQADDGALELAGFTMSAETVAALRAVDLTATAVPGPGPGAGHRRVMLVGQDGFAPDARLRAHLEAAGVEVTEAPGTDYAVLMGDPQDPALPRETIAASIAWLTAGEPDDGPGVTGAGATRQPVRTPSAARISHGGAELTETAVRVGPGFFGVLTEPADGPCADLCAVWLPSGGLRHSGPNRAWVETARRWAARGVPSVRLDLAGIGESDGDERARLPNASLYAPERTDETLAVLEWLVARGLPQRYVLGGLCSGAYWSLHAALVDPRVTAVIAVNLYALQWSEALVAERETQSSLRALQGNAWRRLLHRDLSPDRLARGIAAIRPGRIRAGVGHPLERAQQGPLERALDRLREQGTELDLLLARGEPLRDQLERQRIVERAARWPNLVIEEIPSRDHLFRALGLQRLVHASLDRALDRALYRAGARPEAGRPLSGAATGQSAGH